MSIWDITDRGFLGVSDPLVALVAKNEKYIPAVARLENIASVLPYWIEERCVREELVHELRQVVSLVDNEFLLNQDEAKTERLMHLYSYMASAYVFAKHENIATRLPSEIAVPLAMLAHKLEREPVLSYASCCLTNWERVNPREEIKLDNIKTLTRFSSEPLEKSSEDWFNLIHVDIEKSAAEGVFACKQILENPWNKSDSHNTVVANDMLTKIFVSLAKMNKAMAKMPDFCTPEDYFRWVRPYFSYPSLVVYKGWLQEQPFVFQGQIWAQSSVIPAFFAALGIFTDSSSDLRPIHRQFMPIAHRQFLDNLLIQTANDSVEGKGLRDFASRDSALKEIYNDCIDEIVSFRTKQLEYRIDSFTIQDVKIN